MPLRLNRKIQDQKTGPDYFFEQQVLRRMHNMQITISEAKKMIAQSKPVRHRLGNHQFEEFIFQIDGDHVTSIASLNWNGGENDENTFIVYEVCYTCEGRGCAICDRGEVRVVRKLYDRPFERR